MRVSFCLFCLGVSGVWMLSDSPKLQSQRLWLHHPQGYALSSSHSTAKLFQEKCCSLKRLLSYADIRVLKVVASVRMAAERKEGVKFVNGEGESKLIGRVTNSAVPLLRKPFSGGTKKQHHDQEGVLNQSNIKSCQNQARRKASQNTFPDFRFLFSEGSSHTSFLLIAGSSFRVFNQNPAREKHFCLKVLVDTVK